MPYPAESQPQNTYLLWHVFNYPISNGHEAAFAVTKNWGDSINAIYSLLLQIMLTQAFQLLVLVFILIGNRSPSGFIHVASKYLYENEPIDLLLNMLKSSDSDGGGSYQHAMSRSSSPRRPIKRYPQTVLLFIVGATILFIPSLIPAFAIHGLLIGTSAPVNPAQIFVPHNAWYGDFQDIGQQVPLLALSKPNFLRALTKVETASDDLQSKVSVTPPVTLQDLGNGEKVMRIDYNYSLGAQDFGLQKYNGLKLNVQGSCRTEYGWYVEESSDPILTDWYYIFGNKSVVWSASQSNGYVPMTYARIDDNQDVQMNNTYAIMMSSMQCTSFTNGTDPWYLTNTTAEAPTDEATTRNTLYNVMPKRPGLSCWQSDEWTYKGESSSTSDLSSISGLDFPAPLRDVMFSQLGAPTVYTTAGTLGSVALSSSTTAESIGNIFDANSSSIFNDMKRLVLTAYVMTTNLLPDTTLYNTSNTYGMDSIVSTDNLDQVADFVVSDTEISTISLAFAIAVPIGTLISFVIVRILRSFIKPKEVDGTETYGTGKG